MTRLMDPNRETHLDKEGKALHQLTVSWLNVNVIRNICLYPVIETTLSHELLSANKQHRYSPLIRCRVPPKKKKKRLRYDRGELSRWAVKECGESSCVAQSSHHYFHSVRVCRGFGGRRYVCVDRCFSKAYTGQEH